MLGIALDIPLELAIPIFGVALRTATVLAIMTMPEASMYE